MLSFSRIAQDGTVVGLLACAREPPILDRTWGPIRAVHLQGQAWDLPPGRLPNHLIALNLGRETTVETNFEGRGWEAHRLAHHGIDVIPANVSYAAREREASDALAVEMTPEFVAAALAPEPRAELRPVLGACDPFAAHVLLALEEEARLGGPSSTRRAESLATALVGHLAERQAEGGAPAAVLSSPRLRRVLDFVSQHLDAPMTLRTLAGLAEMDQFRFTRAFKQCTGLSPHRYVLEARVNRAKELLADKQLSITEIALQTGFATPSHFSVTFRRLVNETPRAYRGSAP